MIIDCHTHLNNYTEEPLALEERYRLLKEAMERNHIDHAFAISSYFANEKRPGVDKLIALTRDDPRVHVVEGLSLYGRAPFDLQAIEERLRRREVIALKLYPGYEWFYPHDKICRPIYELAVEYDVPVMVHTGDTYSKRAKLRHAHPLLVDDVAVDYPDVNFVLCHMGNPWFKDAAEVLYKNDNVFADISGLVLGEFTSDFERYMLQQLKEMIMFMGDPGRQMMYGSDWPLVRMGPYVKFLQGLELPEEQMEAVRWQTAARLFRIKT